MHDEGVRCAASLACNYDLLTGGGQYSQMDWRLFPKKFNYAGGLSDIELTYSKLSTTSCRVLGLHESKPFALHNSASLFATTTPQTHASVYRNRVLKHWLIPIANMSPQVQKTSLDFPVTQDARYPAR